MKKKIPGKIRDGRIGVLYGGWSSEREISLRSGKAVLDSLGKSGLEAVGIDVKENFPAEIAGRGIDFAFIVLHGCFGEDGRVQAVLESNGIDYTGSGVLSSALAMDKIFSKQIFEWNGLPTPGWHVIDGNSAEISAGKPGYPVVVKPPSQGSAIGVTIAKNGKELAAAVKKAFRYGRRALVEEYIGGREFTAGILGGKVLPVTEIIPVKSSFYDYKAKYQAGGSNHVTPAEIGRGLYSEIQALAMKAFNCLGCSVWGRVDFRLSRSGKPNILEINTVPGMTGVSLFPEAAKAGGMNFDETVLEILRLSVNAKNKKL